MTKITKEGVRRLLARKCKEAGSQQAWAEKHGISPQYISDAIQGRREVGAKIIAALRLRYIAMFEVIDEEPAPCDDAEFGMKP
jgi:DNA-binding transcriptional regulator YdaS (Cro superfamily)